MFSIGEIAGIVGGELVGDGFVVPTGFAVDSRRAAPGDLFFALRGAHADGHAFVNDALDRGAAGAVLAERPPGLPLSKPVVIARDVRQALFDLAGAWRARFSIPIVAVTGSNGKTTTKALLAHLAEGTHAVHAAPENYNTEIGLPLAILAMPPETELGVFELGADRPGDIAPLVRLLRPSIGILTSIGASHLETFGTPARVAEEKWNLVRGLPPEAFVFVNADSPELSALSRGEQRPGLLQVGISRGDVRARVLTDVPRLAVAVDSLTLRLETDLVGHENATNLLLAALCALRLGVPAATIEERAASFRPVPHRMERRSVRFGVLLDDAYNANPSSMSFALRTLAAFGDATSKRAAVIGDMLGLGDTSATLHGDVAGLALGLQIDAVYPIGERATEAFRATGNPRVRLVERARVAADLVEYLGKETNAVVLVKGSRDMHLEEVVDGVLRLAPHLS